MKVTNRTKFDYNIILVFSLSFAIGVLWLLLFVPHFGASIDIDFIERYEPISLNILNDGEFSIIKGEPTARVSPLYPSLIAFVYYVFGQSVIVARLMNIIFNSLSCTLMYLLIKQIVNRRVGFGASLVLCVYPVFIFQLNIRSPETLFTFLFLLFVLLLYTAETQKKILLYSLAGLILGLTVLCKAVIIILPFIFLIMFLANFIKDRTCSLRGPALFIIFFFIVVSPWVVRNYIVFNEFIPVQVSGGRHFFMGTSRKTIIAQGSEAKTQAILQERLEYNLMGDDVTDEMYGTIAIRRIKDNPVDYIKLMPLKIINFLGGTVSGKWDFILIPLQCCLFFLALIGNFFMMKRNNFGSFFLVTIFYFILIHILGYPLARYSTPIVPLFFLLATYCFVVLYRKHCKKE